MFYGKHFNCRRWKENAGDHCRIYAAWRTYLFYGWWWNRCFGGAKKQSDGFDDTGYYDAKPRWLFGLQNSERDEQSSHHHVDCEREWRWQTERLWLGCWWLYDKAIQPKGTFSKGKCFITTFLFTSGRYHKCRKSFSCSCLP